MQLNNVCGEDIDISDIESRTILHECGHMLGFVHEHQSPARVKEFTYKKKGSRRTSTTLALLITTSATIRYYADTCSPHTVKHNVLRLYDEQRLAAYSAFDDMSIMLFEYIFTI